MRPAFHLAGRFLCAYEHLLALNQQTKPDKRANRHQLVGHQVCSHQRQHRQCCLSLLNRLDVHEADLRSSRAPYIIPNHLAQADPVILHLERWAREHLEEGFSLQEAAHALATSTRTLQRRCQAVLGKSPLDYFRDLRVERARSLVQGSSLDLEAIAAEVGYVDGATLRTLLRQRLGKSVRKLRADLR